jgi:putative ABC transport system permease protein
MDCIGVVRDAKSSPRPAIPHYASWPAVRRPAILPAAVEAIERADIFQAICGFLTPNDTVDINGRLGPITGHLMTRGCFETLGIRPALGRVLAPADSIAGARRVAVLSYDAWESQFGSSVSVLDQTVKIEGEPYAIVGVLERGFTGLQIGVKSPLYWPVREQIDTASGLSPAATLPLDVFARPRPGMTMQDATARLEAVWPHVLDASLPAQFTGVRRDRYLQHRLVVTEASTGIDYYGLRRGFEKPFRVLLAVSITILLVSSINIANLLLTRRAERRREILVRSALGASRWRLLREALAESGVLLAAGIIGGLILSYWSTAFLVALYGRMVPLSVGFAVDIAPDRRVLGFTMFVSAVAFLVFGAIPAWTASKGDLSSFNAASTRLLSNTSAARRVAIVAQVALTIVLVAVGGLAVRALAELKGANLGLGIDRVIGAQLVAIPRGYQRGFSGATYYRDLLARIGAIPGVESTALSQPLPVMSGSYPVRLGISGDDHDIEVERALVSDGFFSTVQIPVVSGAGFRRTDHPQGALTAILSESAARALFGQAAPIGRAIRVGSTPSLQQLEVIGIVPDVLLRGTRQKNTRTVYLNYWQADAMSQYYPSLVVRTNGDPRAIVDSLDQVVRDAGHEYPFAVRTLVDVRDQSLAPERLMAMLSAAFASIGLALAAVGIFGVLSYSTVRRTPEIGIRMALGADRKQIAWLVLSHATNLVAIGVLLGAPASWMANKAIAALVYRPGSFGLMPQAVAIVFLLLVTAAAAWLPVRRATAVEPLTALRLE